MTVFRESRRLTDGTKRSFPRYRGWVRMPGGSRKKHVLFTDKLVSEKKLRELQRQADLESIDGQAARLEREGKRPISDHVADYIASLKLNSASVDHASISEGMLNRLLKATEWKLLRDITVESVEAALPVVAPLTHSYRNCFIKRIKAFCAWLVARGRLREHPLRALRRLSERKATRNRGRRAASWDDLLALLSLKIPDDRLLCYALAGLNGFRRNEIASLTFGDLHLSAIVPFVELGRKMGESDQRDALPLHPFVVRLLRARSAAMPGVGVVRAVPDVATLKRDWAKAKVEFASAGGRLDFHALRHTFCSLLDLTGASRATKKRLMRHAGEDVTDGYSHAELREMCEALSRLPDPDRPQVVRALATGTYGAGIVGSQLGQTSCGAVQNGAGSCTLADSPSVPENVQNPSENPVVCGPVQGGAQGNLNAGAIGDIVSKMRPDTQVD